MDLAQHSLPTGLCTKYFMRAVRSSRRTCAYISTPCCAYNCVKEVYLHAFFKLCHYIPVSGQLHELTVSLPGKQTSSTHSPGDCMGPKASRNAVDRKVSIPATNQPRFPTRRACDLVTIMTELSQPGSPNKSPHCMKQKAIQNLNRNIH
jgi:hypothetical protein